MEPFDMTCLTGLPPGLLDTLLELTMITDEEKASALNVEQEVAAEKELCEVKRPDSPKHAPGTTAFYDMDGLMQQLDADIEKVRWTLVNSLSL